MNRKTPQVPKKYNFFKDFVADPHFNTARIYSKGFNNTTSPYPTLSHDADPIVYIYAENIHDVIGMFVNAIDPRKLTSLRRDVLHEWRTHKGTINLDHFIKYVQTSSASSETYIKLEVINQLYPCPEEIRFVIERTL
jgi:hypothetical protein